MNNISDRLKGKVIDLLKSGLDLTVGDIKVYPEARGMLLYRLEKYLCSSESEGSTLTYLEIFDAEIKRFSHESVVKSNPIVFENTAKQIASILNFCKESAALLANARTYPGQFQYLTDDFLAPIQRRTVRMDSQPDTLTSWGRDLPYRPIFCILNTIASSGDVTNTIRQKYKRPRIDDELPGSDNGGDRRHFQSPASALLDAIDYGTGKWKGPFKVETSFSLDPPNAAFMGTPNLKPLRINNTYWVKPKRVCCPDIVILNDRTISGKQLTPSKVSHCVDTKFWTDKFNDKQVSVYKKLFNSNVYGLYFPTDCTLPIPKELTDAEFWKTVGYVVAMILVCVFVVTALPAEVVVGGILALLSRFLILLIRLVAQGAKYLSSNKPLIEEFLDAVGNALMKQARIQAKKRLSDSFAKVAQDYLNPSFSLK